MQAVGRLGSYISQGVYTVSGPFHPFGGAVDIVVVQQQDGTFKSSPWYVRFGKFQGVLKAKEKVVEICVNDVQAHFRMHLDHKGEAFFLREIPAQEHQDSPFLSPADDRSNEAAAAAGRPGSRILGLVFGRRSMKREDGDGSNVNRAGSLERAEIAADLLDLNWSTNLSAQQRHSDIGGSSNVEVKFEAHLQRHNISEHEEEEISLQTSETSELVLDCSSQQTHQVTYHVHVRDQTLLLSQGAEIEEVVTQSSDLGMSVLEVSQFHSQVQHVGCSDSDFSMYNDVDVEDRTSPKRQTVNVGIGQCSSEKVESNCVSKPSSSSSLDDQALGENNVKDKDVSSRISSPPDSLGDCSPSKASRRTPLPSSGDGNYHFNNESGVNDRLERSFCRKYVDKDHTLCENGTEKLTVISSPIAIPRNEPAGEEVGQQHTGSSLPSSKGVVQHDVRYPLSQSLDSKSSSLLWEFPEKNDLRRIKSDNDQENRRPHEKPGAKDYHDSGEFKGDPSTHNHSPGGNWRIWPFSSKKTGSRNPKLPPTPSDAQNATFGNSSENTISTDVNKDEQKPNIMNTKVRETTPTSEQIASLNLKDGMNTVTFTFSTAVLGKQQVDARIYLWKWNTRIVISDVDGTITRSDVLGQFMPLVGVDWSQTGVAHLFSAIKENGYQLLFLSARSISQAYITRQFLLNLKQDGKVLPDGPVVISPDGLFPSLYREVIKRVPHEFKIACLEDIRALFPSDCNPNPFYAGFGNRDSDEISYLKVGIPKGKIFIINPKGEIVVNRGLNTKSYTTMHALVNGMFPPVNTSEQEDFNSWNFWKLPPPSIDI